MNKKLLVVVLGLGLITTVFVIWKLGSGYSLFVGSRVPASNELSLPSSSGTTSYGMMGTAPQKMMQTQPDTVNRMPVSISPPMGGGYGGGGNALDVNNRVYMKTSSFGVVVPDVTRYVTDMTAYFTSIQGRILSSQMNTYGKYMYAYMTVKVPVDKYDEANMKVRNGVKKILNQSVNSTDETGTYTNVTTNLADLEQKKLDKEKELLTVYTDAEKKRIQLEIDQLSYQIKYSQDQVKQVDETVNWATVTITASDSESYFKPYDPSASTDLKDVLDQSLSQLGRLFIMIAALLIQVLVFSVLWLPVLLVIKLVVSKIHRP